MYSCVPGIVSGTAYVERVSTAERCVFSCCGSVWDCLLGIHNYVRVHHTTDKYILGMRLEIRSWGWVKLAMCFVYLLLAGDI